MSNVHLQHRALTLLQLFCALSEVRIVSIANVSNLIEDTSWLCTYLFRLEPPSSRPLAALPPTEH
jgi:hypothetical protein